MYEPHHLPPIPAGRFAIRIIMHGAIALGIVAISLFIGIAGYMATEQMGMLDAFLNSSMLLGGMGPVKTEGLTPEGKLFAGCYALYAGLVFIAVMSIMLAPVVHRVMHRYHWDEKHD